MTYQSVNEFFCGEDLVQPTPEEFVRVLCHKIGISSDGVKATSYNNTVNDQDVVAALRVTGKDAKRKVGSILDWFWDTPEHLGKGYRANQMLKFHEV